LENRNFYIANRLGLLVAISLSIVVLNAKVIFSQQKTSPSQQFWQAAQSGDLASVKKAIEEKIDVNAKTEYGVTALSMASDHGHENIVALLIEKGADPNTKDRFYQISPLGWAVSRGHVGIAGRLIDAGATDIDTALGGAVGMKNEAMVSKILGTKKASEKAMIASLRAAISMKSSSIEELLSKEMSDAAKAEARKEVSDAAMPSKPPGSPDNPSKGSIELRDDFSFESRNWPQFRGWMSRGVGSSTSSDRSAALPDTWDGESMENIAWKCPIPGLGTSSPIVWGDQVFITTAIRDGDTQGFRVGPYGDVESVASNGECRFLLISISLNDGKEQWQKELNRAVPKVKRHAKSSHANPTPATDGKHVIASFAGDGVYCCNMQGDLIWSCDLGMLDSGWFYDKSYQWGFGSSPCIFEDMVILQCDCQEGSFISALDIRTGEEKWRTPREEIPTWGSPVVFVTDDGTPTIIVSGTKCTAAYHARTGVVLWQMGGFSEIVVPTPQVTRDLSILCSGYAPVRPIVALRHGAQGKLKLPSDKESDPSIAWSLERAGPYMPTPLIQNNKLYVLENSGILSCYALESGKQVFKQRVRSDIANAYTASPVALDGKLYLVSEAGLTFVVAMDAEGTVVSKNAIGESVLASPAIAKGRLLLRGEKHLFAIGNKN
jgi:outer membrane protein assembly factor BamB